MKQFRKTASIGAKVTVGSCALPVAGSRLWNSLPPDVTMIMEHYINWYGMLVFSQKMKITQNSPIRRRVMLMIADNIQILSAN